jgi:hypothetical protein
LNKKLLFVILLLIQITTIFSQDNAACKELRFTSHYTSFPDSVRSKVYIHEGSLYSVKEHYSDSSVFLVAPETLHQKNKVDLVFWFHGWNNNIDTANLFYQIEKQFLASGKTAVLVLAETARNAPDSYGGKLEQKGIFRGLVKDVLNQLKKENLINQKTQVGSITLAGHSGAFRVIAYILANGEMPVNDVFLFDALYSQTDKFLSWIEENKQHRFINWYTNHGGGTDQVSIQMMQQLNDLHLPYQLVEESTLDGRIIKTNRILFVHSPREHNVIINRPDNFQLILQNNR